MQFSIVVRVVEKQLGMSWRDAAETLAEGGVTLAFDAKTQGVVVLVKSHDEQGLTKARDTLLRLASNGAKEKGNEGPVKQASYRDVDVYKLDKALLATKGRWAIITNKPKLGRQVVDNLLDGAKTSLAGSAEFIAARKAIADKPLLWAVIRTMPLRNTGIAKTLLADKSENPAAEILLGGVLDTLKKTPYVTAALYSDKQQTRLTLSTPHNPAWTSKPRAFYFGSDGKGRAPRPLEPQGTILSIRAHRDLGAIWQSAPDLFDENANAQLAQADSNLSTFFSGKEFGREILGSLGPELQIVVARRDGSAKDTPSPAIKLPAGAIVFQLKEPKKMGRQLRVTFQSIIGFLNIVGGQQKRPPLEASSQKLGTATIVSTHYLTEDSDKPGKEAEIYYNFTPSIALAGDRFIVSSTRGLATQLAKLVQKQSSGPKPAPSDRAENAAIRLNVQGVREALPNGKRDFYSFVTGGMSDMPMNSPSELGGESRRIELVFYASDDSQEYAEFLRRLAHFAHDNNTWLHWGHTMPNGTPPTPLFGNDALDTIFFMPSIVSPDSQLGERLTIKSDPVNLVWCVPITNAECQHKLDNGTDALYDLFDANDHPFVFAGQRASYI